MRRPKERSRHLTPALMIILLAALSCACDGRPLDAGKTAKPANSTSATDLDTSNVTTPSPPRIAAQPPSPSSMMYMIYQKDGDGALSYEIENGSVATYWYSHTFDLGGKHWHTAFAYSTPEKYGGPADETPPAPDTTVTIAQATMVKDSADSEKPWVFSGNDYSVGEFGAYERAGEIDKSRKLENQASADGRLVLAIPTTFFANGIKASSYEVFVFNPADLDLKANYGQKRWTHVGNIPAGEDNDADCGPDAGDRTCYRTRGILSFTATGGNDLPDIRVTLSGDAQPGAAEGQVADYAFDAGRKQYLERP